MIFSCPQCGADLTDEGHCARCGYDHPITPATHGDPDDL